MFQTEYILIIEFIFDTIHQYDRINYLTTYCISFSVADVTINKIPMNSSSIIFFDPAHNLINNSFQVYNVFFDYRGNINRLIEPEEKFEYFFILPFTS